MDLKEKTQNYNRHPWEISRAKKLLNMTKKFILDKDIVTIADIGAGDMYFDELLYNGLKDENITAKIFAVDKEYSMPISIKDEIVMLNDIQLLEKDSIDCIIMMDVLEHLDDDSKFLELVLNRLKENGVLIITVPAFQSLFSSHDKFLLHFRRYQYKDLFTLLLSNNVKVLYSHYFYTSLFFLRYMQVVLEKIGLNKKDTGTGMWKYNQENIITKVIELVLNIDFCTNEILNKVGVILPGLSLLAVAKKQNAFKKQI